MTEIEIIFEDLRVKKLRIKPLDTPLKDCLVFYFDLEDGSTRILHVKTF